MIRKTIYVAGMALATLTACNSVKSNQAETSKAPTPPSASADDTMRPIDNDSIVQRYLETITEEELKEQLYE